MRSFAAVGVCLAICINLTACDSATQRHYRSAGIGTELYTSELPETTKLLDDYVDYICDQAGLNAQSCAQSALQPSGWTVFVQAGMNDIDRRCDSYLSWLDDQKRSKQPILQQIADSNAATQIILAEAGVGAAPMAIVGAAFGFARHTFTNIQSRLIMEINTSSVQSLVLSRQKNYRLDILGDSRTPGVRIPNKPMALHALRSYLRICMPFTIETEINTTLAAVDRGDANSVLENPTIDARTAGSLVLGSSTQEMPRPVTPPPIENGDTASLGGVLDIKNIQTMLCQPQPVTGRLGPETRAAISRYLAGRSLAAPNRNITPTTQISPRVASLLQQAANNKAGCFDPQFKFANAFEVGRYGYPKAQAADAIKHFQEHLGWALKKTIPSTGSFDAVTRAAIADLRLSLLPAGTPRPAPKPADQVLDPKLDTAVMSTPEPKEGMKKAPENSVTPPADATKPAEAPPKK